MIKTQNKLIDLTLSGKSPVHYGIIKTKNNPSAWKIISCSTDAVHPSKK